MEPRRNIHGLATESESRAADKNPEISSDMVENAHASGDGALEKNDENILRGEDEDPKTEHVNY